MWGKLTVISPNRDHAPLNKVSFFHSKTNRGTTTSISSTIETEQNDQIT